MAVPTTNVKFSDIWSEANGAYSTGILNFNSMSFFSYFAGPNGTNTQVDNNWGQGEGSGANRIYGTSAKTTNIQVGDFDGLTYFYDNTNFLVKVDFTNNLPANAPFPPPGTNNDVTIDVTLFDSTYITPYGVNGSSMVTTNGGTYNATISQASTSPIIFRGYWKVDISPSPNLVAGALVDITINGSAKVTNGGINAGPTPTTFDGATYGTQDVAYNGTLGGDGLLIVVTCHT